MSTLALAVVVGLIALAGIVTALAALPKRLAGQTSAGGLRGPAPVVVLLGLVGVALTIPVAPPFALGMRLGIGFGVGILIALTALCARALHEARLPALSGAAALRLAGLLLGVGILGLLGIAMCLRGYADDAIIGAALGVVTGLLVARPAFRADVAPVFDWFATTFVILAGAQYLAVHHFPAGGLLAQLAPLLVGAAMVVGLLIASGLAGQSWLGEDKPLALLITTGTALLLTVLVGQVTGMLQVGAATAAMLPNRLKDLSHDGLVLAIGAVVAAVILWLLYAARRETEQREKAPCCEGWAGAVAALLVILLVAIGFRQLAGWGLALVLLPLAVAAVTALAAGGEGAPMLRALQLGALVLMWRMLLQRAGPDAHPEVDQHYMLIGLLLGMAGPLMLRDLVARSGRPGQGLAAWLGYAARLLLPLVILPVAVLVVWDFKALAGLYWGFIAAGFYVLYVSGADERRPTPPLDGLGAPLPEGRGNDNGNVTPAGSLALLMALLGVQFMPVLMPLTDLSRANKLLIVLALTVLGAIWVAVGHCAGRTPALPLPAGRGACEAGGVGRRSASPDDTGELPPLPEGTEGGSGDAS